LISDTISGDSISPEAFINASTSAGFIRSAFS
jgi:hypothetical protein